MDDCGPSWLSSQLYQRYVPSGVFAHTRHFSPSGKFGSASNETVVPSYLTKSFMTML